MREEEITSEQLLKQFQITEEDLSLIKEFGLLGKADVAILIKDFYIWLENQSWYDQYFSSGVPSAVKTLQSDYWKRFLEGCVDEQYVKQRVTVGNVHARINLPVTAYLAGMNFAHCWFSTVAQKSTKNLTKCIDLLNAISKLIQLDCNIVMHVYSLQSLDTIRKQGEITSQIVNETTRVIRAAAEGNFSTVYAKQDDSDVLEAPINQMINNLKQFNEENQKDKWLKNGIAELSLNLRGGLSISQMADNAIEFIANYLNAQVGVLYVTEKGISSLAASYAFIKRKNLNTTFKPGEGIVGQAMKEKKTILLTDVPSDYISINSGLGESAPGNIIVQPLVYQNEVKGVIELGSFTGFEESHLSFLGIVSESIAVSINSAQDQEVMHQLLIEAQQTSSKLQLQQDELESANQTLEEQAQALKQSEEELTLQRDMLEASNSELKSKTIDLEKQRSEVELATEELQKKADQLATASKYKSEFLANMSHELRTPLNSLLLLSETMMMDYHKNLNAEQIEDLKIIHSGGKSLLNLINDILDLSKIEAGKMTISPENVDLERLITGLETQFKAIAKEKNLAFKISMGNLRDVTIHTDVKRLEQILRNFLSNAFKFTVEGEIELSVNRSYLNALNGFCVTFSVKDTGIGIDPKNQSLIFQTFQQIDGSTARNYSGTGLGLAISKELATLLGGSIDVKSSVGQGSEFQCHLPCKVQSSNLISKATQSQQVNSTSPYSESSEVLSTSLATEKQPDNPYVLIVESDQSLADVISTDIKKLGFDTKVTQTGNQAISLINENLPSAVVLDLNVSEMDGLEFLVAIKAAPKTISLPIHIFSSGPGKSETFKKCAIEIFQNEDASQSLLPTLSRFQSILKKRLKTALIVNDSGFKTEALESELKENGFELVLAESESNALEALNNSAADFCILNVGESTSNGASVLDNIASGKISNSPPLILYTSDESQTEYNRLSEFSQYVGLSYEFDPDNLPTEIENFLVSHSVPKEPQKQPTNQTPASSSNTDLAGISILIVDDDIRNVYAISKILRKQGMNVSLADNGKLAIVKLLEDNNIDVVLMDIMMPVMDGYEAMIEIRSKVSDNIPIIALTAKAMAADREKCIEAGANDYMSKPVEIHNLLAMLKLWCFR
ncbi:response regulator [Motilimonas cestriensis]|uniref:histidine kinase n=1 Tax=Motilimonas cestriensis TaxID=2742685 RepID=A0ABS8WDS7_9GAMM|nr:response regulator [Motilimonas cestriensis]MCE2596650.1 response regulator [Motilimonas cestriensis]